PHGGAGEGSWGTAHAEVGSAPLRAVSGARGRTQFSPPSALACRWRMSADTRSTNPDCLRRGTRRCRADATPRGGRRARDPPKACGPAHATSPAAEGGGRASFELAVRYQHLTRLTKVALAASCPPG